MTIIRSEDQNFGAGGEVVLGSEMTEREFRGGRRGGTD